MKIINKEHPQWIAYWNSSIEFITPTPQINKHWAEMEDVLLEWPDYKCAWLFIDAQGGQYIVAKEDGLYKTWEMGSHGGDSASFETLEDAAAATFADWFPECSKGDWDDNGDYIVDGLWMIKEVQA